MKVKHALSVGGASLLTLGLMGYMVYDGLTMTEKEVKTYLEDFHKTEVNITSVADTKDGKIYTVQALENPTVFEFEALVAKSDNNKAYVKSSSYDSEKARQGVTAKVDQFLPFLEDLGFELYRGGTVVNKDVNPFAEDENKDGKEQNHGIVEAEEVEPEIEPYSVGISSDGTVSTRISLLYKEPLTLFTLDESYDILYNAVKAIKGMELENPYLDIRGKDGKSTSGRVILADLDNLNSSEDVFNIVTNSLSSSENVPSITLTDEEIEEMGLNKDK